MANKLLQLPGNRLFNNSNIASPGGTATLYLSQTSTLANFLDAAGVPLGPTLTANGLGQLPDAYGDETVAYRLILRDSSGVQLDGGDIDPFYFGRDNSLITTTAGSSVSTRALLAAIANPAANQSAILTESGREGAFVFSTADLSAEVTADTQQGIYVAPSSDTTGASGAWVRKAHTITPFMFGAVGDGSTDDVAALTAFNAIVFGTAARTEYADWSGDFAISGKLTIGPAAVSGEVTEYNVGGRLNLTQLTATFESVRLRNLYSIQWKGFIGVNGIGSTSFASRTCGVGICLQQCARLKIGGLYANNFWFSGITYDPAYNSNGAEIGLIQASNIGSGHNYSGAGNGLTGNWSAAVNAGSSGSTSQTTTLTVDTLPDAAIETYQSFGNIQCHVRISGYLYFVSSVDQVNSKITIFPWIDPAAGASGTYEWVFGGAHEPVGSNANVIKVGLLDAIRCGKGAAEASVYPSRYGSTILNQCGVHVMVGQSPTASSIGLSIDSLYIEGGTSGEHVVVAHRFGNATNSHYIGSSYELDLSKCWMIGDPRVTAGNIKGGWLGSYANRTGVTIGSKGKLLRFHNNNLSSQSSTSIGLTGQSVPPVPVILQRDSQTVLLQVIGSGEYNRLFGYSGGIIGYVGSGTNSAPTGSFVFTPPSGGTINGGAVDATVTFSGPFDGPVLFSYEHSDTAQLTWKVRPICGQSRSNVTALGYGTGAGGTVTQATSKTTGVTLSKLSGQITMNAAALAAGAKASFVVTNSNVAATDTVLVCVASGGTANAYRAAVTAVAAGSFTITVENITAGSLSEAPVLSFSVIKAAAA